MALVTLCEETDSSRTAKVLGNRGLKVAQAYSYFSMPSASGTGTVFSGSGILHAIVVTNSATAGTVLWLFDCDGATAGAIGTSASAVVRWDLTSVTKGDYVYNAIINGGLRYRLSACEGYDGVTIMYTQASV